MDLEAYTNQAVQEAPHLTPFLNEISRFGNELMLSSRASGRNGSYLCAPVGCELSPSILLQLTLNHIVTQVSSSMPEIRGIDFSKDPHLLGSPEGCQSCNRKARCCLQKNGFQLPPWISCSGRRHSRDWRRWRLLAKMGVKSRTIPMHVAREAAKLIRTFKHFAKEWRIHLKRFAGLCWNSGIWCKEEDREICSNVITFTSFAEVPAADDRWQLPEWLPWSYFCPIGYIVALIVKGRASRVARNKVMARHLFFLAHSMLGGVCSYMDLLDSRLWGISSEDLWYEIRKVDWEAPPVESVHASRDGWGLQGENTQQLQWHALQLNTLVRSRLRVFDTPGDSSPSLVLLAFPSYLMLFVIPMLEHLWGESLRLLVLFLGRYDDTADKCPECMKKYRGKYVVDNPVLKAVPFDSSEKTITWSADFGVNEFRETLREVFSNLGSRGDVLLSTSPLWMSMAIAEMDSRPHIALDLNMPYLFGPDPLKPPDDLYEHDLRVAEKLRDWCNSRIDKVDFLIVRDEPMRSYGGGDYGPNHARIPGFARGIFTPWVFLPSLYVSARYACETSNSQVLVMREGSSSWAGTGGKFSGNMRGQIFHRTLSQFTNELSPWSFRFLPYSLERLTMTEIAKHRAAVWVPLVHFSKQTFNDLAIMEIPIFMPSPRLQVSISASYFCALPMRATAQINVPLWIVELCRWEEIERKFALSKFYRYPHIQRFSSLTDLMMQLVEFSDCRLLGDVSKKMSQWNKILVEDDSKFWRAAIRTLWMQPNSGSSAHLREGKATPDFVLPYAPDEHRCREYLETHYCDLNRDSHETHARCCEHVQSSLEKPIHEPSQPPSHFNGDLCTWQFQSCSSDILRYATHLNMLDPSLTQYMLE